MSNVIHPKGMFTDKKERVREMTVALEKGVTEIFSSGEYERYLKTMSKFHSYSFGNIMLIKTQVPEATRVAGYVDWQKKFKRHVRKGEKAIYILGPCIKKYKETDEDGNEVEKKKVYFVPRQVYDISQTDGEPLPSIKVTELGGDVDGYDNLVQKLRNASPVDIGFEDIRNGSKGYYNLVDKRIAIKDGMSQMQTIKTMVHEITHSILHDKDNGEEAKADRRTMEVQAESVAYVVNSYLGLDTSDYSFGYIAGWSSGKETKELKASLNVIQKTAHELIEAIA